MRPSISISFISDEFPVLLNMKSHFIEEVQMLMDIHQLKQAEREMNKSNYSWLFSKKNSLVYMSTKDEIKIMHGLTKITVDQQVQTMKQLMAWLAANPSVDARDIPQMTLRLLENAIAMDLLSRANFSRAASFRNSLRRLSLMSNRVAPARSESEEKSRRLVTFNDVPVVYRIS